MENKLDFLKIAIESARAGGLILEKYFETNILKEFKEDTSIVTLADKESEDAIKKIILDNFPDHSILGEESGMLRNNTDYVWYIDPLDGTTNFSNGIPIFAISIALEYKKEIVVGVVYNPITHSLFYAELGKGAYFNDEKILVSTDDENHCVVTASASKRKEDKNLVRELYYTLPNRVRSMRNLGSTSVELAYVARGGIEANIQIGLQTYDFAAGTLLIKEAGGKITTLDGGNWEFPNNYFITSNGVFHDILVDEVQKQKDKLGIE